MNGTSKETWWWQKMRWEEKCISYLRIVLLTLCTHKEEFYVQALVCFSGEHKSIEIINECFFLSTHSFYITMSLKGSIKKSDFIIYFEICQHTWSISNGVSSDVADLWTSVFTKKKTMAL